MNNHPLYTRRDFLASGLKGAGLVAAWGFVPSFLTRAALAATPDKDNTVLVVVQLSGGNDGLNTVVPFADDNYFNLRPNIGLKQDALWTLSDTVGLHTGLNPLRELYDDARVSIIQGVGYPNPNRSHFQSMDIWHTAKTEMAGPSNGWLGRYFDNQCKGADPRNEEEGRRRATIGVSMGKIMPQAFRNSSNVALALDNPETFRWNVSGETSGLARTQEQLFARINQPQPQAANHMGGNQHGGVTGNSAEALDFLKHTAMNAVLAGDQVRDLLAKYKGKVDYPNSGLSGQLQMVAKLIAGNLPTRVYYVHQGGYDTHANQLTSHDRLLGDLAGSLKAFQQDIALQGNADRVLCLAFSEFGRRAAENGSAGTDHGAAGPMFMVGPKLKAGLHGKNPDLVDLIDGDVRHQTDFRQVYANVLEDWLGVNSKEVLGGDYPKVQLI